MKCPHLYEIISETKDGIKERCKLCRKILITTKDKNGNSNNEVFRKEHVVDFSQPGGATGKIFDKFYGDRTTKKTR